MESQLGSLIAELSGNNELESASIPQITSQIILLKNQTALNIFEIGRRLIEVKKRLHHGEWGDWLTREVEFSHRTANNFMRAAEAVSNSQSLANLAPTKIFALLELPPDERETFIAQPHQVAGESKTVDDMTTRELQEAIRAKNEVEGKLLKVQGDLDIERRAKEEAREYSHDQSKTIRELQKKLEDRPEKEVPPKDYQQMKSGVDKLTRNVNDLQTQLNDMKSQKSILEMQLKEHQSSRVDEKMSIQVSTGVFCNNVKEFIDKNAAMTFLSKDYVHTSPDCQKRYENALAMLEKFCSEMRDNIILPKEGKVINAEVINL